MEAIKILDKKENLNLNSLYHKEHSHRIDF